MYWRTLDKIDSSLYKGIAILMIATHNFMHLFPKPKENEFGFYPDRFFDFLHLAYSEPENILRTSLSFLGHFGVQIFIFLSAYGLTKKYSSKQPDYWPFIWQRIMKIYPAFLIAILAWLIIVGWFIGDYGFLGPAKLLYANIIPLVLKLSLLSSFTPEYYFSPVGPWWFIPFIFQFYLTFPLLRYLHSRYGNRALLFLSLTSLLISLLTQGKIGELNLYFTVLGHLPALCLGIFLASNDDKKINIPKSIILLALGVFLLGNIYETFWYANHISFLILILAFLTYLSDTIKNTRTIRKTLLFYGSLSMPLFLVNGFLRAPFITWAIDYNHWSLTLILCLISLSLSTLVALALDKIEKRLMLKIEWETPRSLYNQFTQCLTKALTRVK
ncbi:acyltransferase [Kistimonas scapharcae]|uniref:acyltransferase family protein n=1 Tax=Kistimonas scapharcae TaxID=1036133 RepID=UPI0031E8EB07